MNVGDIKIQIKSLQDTLTSALNEAKSLNEKADAVVDQGLATIEQSRYTAPIVIGISIGMLSIGGLIGWAAKSLFA